MATERATLRRWLAAPVDGRGAAAFRVLFGAILFASCVRFAAKGWIDEFYVAPVYHFGWPGFAWLVPWPRVGMYAHFALMALAALGIASGVLYRLSAVVFLVAFSCVELFDKTYYLNHYYLVSLLALLLCVMPIGRASVIRACSVPRWTLVLLRAQLAIVYFHAGLAKLGEDWLLRGEPLAHWLSLHADLPLVGPLLAQHGTAIAMSWAGAIFDLTIAAFLLWPRTRMAAYGAVVVFHAVTGLLLPIGIFPVLMIGLTTIFLRPDWPALVARRVTLPEVVAAPASRAALAPAATLLLAAYLSLQLLLPLRHLAYPGEVNWTEEGFRFAWRVMLIEKTGSVELRVHDPATGQTWRVSPRRELTRMQLQMMSTQPDMIAQYARHVAARFAREDAAVEVYADAWVSLNGRRPQRLIDPAVDLAQPENAFARRAYVLALRDDAVAVTRSRDGARTPQAPEWQLEQVARNSP
jgi:vitamin K-dependent gamma-carboxylase